MAGAKHSLAHDIDVYAEQILYVLGELRLVEQGCVRRETDQQVEVAAGTIRATRHEPRATDPNTCTSSTLCRFASARTCPRCSARAVEGFGLAADASRASIFGKGSGLRSHTQQCWTDHA